MKKIFVIALLLIVATSVNAQTRRIAHRSHGGSSFEHYDGLDGSYGIPSHMPPPPPRPLVKIHLESGRDTIVSMDDTLTRANYGVDTAKTIYKPVDQKKKIRKPNEMGNVAGKLVM